MPKCPADCGADIMFLRNDKTDSLAPVNPGAVPDGNVTIDFNHGTYHVLTKVEIGRLEYPGMFAPAKKTPRFKLHFVDCPNAEKFRSCRQCHHSPCTCEHGGEG